MSPSGKRDFEISFWESRESVERESQRELRNTIVKIQAFAIFNINKQFFLHYSVLYGCLCVFHIYAVNVYMCWCILQELCLISGLKVFEASYQEGVTERWGFWEPCTEDALLNSEESDKDVLRHRTEVNNSGRRPVRLLNTSGGKAVWVRTQLQTESLRILWELCQVGIEHVYRGAQRKELCWEFKGTESLRILGSSAKWALSKCIGAQKKNSAVSSEDRITKDSESSARRALSRCKGCTEGRQNYWTFCGEDTPPGGRRESVQAGTESEENSLSSAIWRKSPLRDLSLGYWIPRKTQQEVAWAEG
jgi:hypothetical protein